MPKLRFARNDSKNSQAQIPSLIWTGKEPDTNRISIIGAGNVGATCAQRILEKGYADVVLLDIIEGLPQGRALDISQSAPILRFNTRIIGTNDYQDTADSDVVIITSGASRKPGMTRDELLTTNANIVTEVTRNVIKYSPDCIIVMVTNPVDVMTHLALRLSGFSRDRVLGLSGVLDGARLATFIAAELNVSVEGVSPCVLGQHGENMVVIPRLTTVHGTPITEILPAETISRLVERTVKGGAEIISLLKTGSAYYTPSAAAVQMAEAIVRDEKRVLTCAAYLDGEYGLKDTVIGVPVKLGRNGIEQIIELELTAAEKAQLAASAESVKQTINKLKIG